MFHKAAKGISYIFHPVFIPTYLIIALKLLSPLPVFYIFFNNKLFYALLMLVATYTAIIPLAFVYLQYRMHFIKDYTLDNRKERPRVYLFTSGFFVALAYFLYAKGSLFMPTAVIIASMAVSIICLFLFNFFDKISAHTAGFGGVLGIFFGIYLRYRDPSLVPVILLLLIMLGSVASSRLLLGAHNLRQVTIGAALGFITGFIGTFNFMKL